MNLSAIEHDLTSFCLTGQHAAWAREIYGRDGCLSKKQIRQRARKEWWARMKKKITFIRPGPRKPAEERQAREARKAA
jgi:hypothetical protein